MHNCIEQHLKYWCIAHVQEAEAHCAKMESNNVTIRPYPYSSFGTSLSLAISVCLFNLSFSLFLLSLSSLLAINSTPQLLVQLTGFCVCKVIGHRACDAHTQAPINHRVFSVNCRACDARTTNQPPCMLRKLSGIQCLYH